MNIGAARSEVERRRWEGIASYVFLAVLTLMAAAYCVRIFQISLDNEDRLDFSHYYTSSYLLRRGVDPYTADLVSAAVALGFEAPDVTRATNPPTLVILLEPLTLFRPHVAYWIWFAMNLGFFAVFFALASAEFQIGARVGWALTCLSLMYPPVVIHFHFAQSQILVLLLLMLALSFLRRERYGAAGAMIAFATLIKIFPVVMVGYLVARRRWTALRYTVAWGVIAGLLTVAIAGVKTCVDFVSASAQITSLHWLLEAGNISINGMILRCVGFAVGEGASRHLLSILHPLIILVELAVFAITLLLSARPRSTRAIEASAFGLWIVAATVLSPTSWVHYLVLLLIPFWQIGICAAEGRLTKATLWTAAASYFFTYITVLGVDLPSKNLELKIAAFSWNQLRFAAPLFGYIATYLLMRDLTSAEAKAGTSR